jgi:predicted Fe-Mo cluster-binding NifX family protein
MHEINSKQPIYAKGIQESMAHRIAISTTDRLTIHRHFGHTTEYHIVDVGDDDYAFVDVRIVPEACRGGAHDHSVFDAVLELLNDCEAIVVGKIGPGASDYLLRKKMRVFEAPGVVEKVLREITDRKLLDQEA